MSADPDAIKSFVSGIRELVKVRRERDEALATIERVKALHVIDGKHARLHWCANDKMSWPCPTIRALEEPS